MANEPLLSTADHDRSAAGYTYVYPVVSRRAGGLSIGINLNPNNACNWRCVYCQVPNLERGKPPSIDVDALQRELDAMLTEVVHGDFLTRRVPAGLRQLVDVALSGNGEPTTATEFGSVIAAIEEVLQRFDVLGGLKVVLITNGSMMNRSHVQEAVRHLARLNGEIWFKIDAATDEGLRRVNGASISPEQQLDRLESAALRCPTWIQTCVFRWHGVAPASSEQEAYLALIAAARRRQLPLRGVLLYTLARPSLQPEARELAPLPREWLEAFAQRIEAQGLVTRVSG